MADSTSGATNILQSLGLTQTDTTQATQPKKKELGQADFLTLLTTQMKAQDPTNPMDSQQFLAQLAQFSTVQGIQDLQKTVTSLASSLAAGQSLQASQLVGHAVLVPGSSGQLTTDGGMVGAVDLAQQVPDLSIKIYDSGGTQVRTIHLDDQPAGLVDFKWDGLNDHGAGVAAGQYQLSAEGTVDGTATKFDTYTLAKVQSVSTNASDGTITLNTDSAGAVAVDKVRQIY